MKSPTYREAVYFPRPGSGYLRIAGPHQADFLQRQTTNHVKALAPGQTLLSVLTNPMARILDVFTLFIEQAPGRVEASIGALTLSGRATTTAAYLKSRIFFMDKVTVADVRHDYTQVDLIDTQDGMALPSLGLSTPLLPGLILPAKVNGSDLLVLGPVQGINLGYRLVIPFQALEQVLGALYDAGIRRLTDEEYQILRVEAGLPGESELTEEYTPLEIGLQAAISDHKGCYTGQEVIARQLTYDKITRRLAGLRLGAAAPAGTPVLSAGKPVGSITCAVHSPTFGPIALAVLRRPFHEAGTRLIAHVEGNEIEAQVTGLPFQEQRA